MAESDLNIEALSDEIKVLKGEGPSHLGGPPGALNAGGLSPQ